MIQADLYKRSTRNQAGRLRNQTYSAAFKSCRNGDWTPNSPAKLLDTSRIFFCQEPSSTPTTRFWFPTFPILKGKGRQRPHRSPARTAGQLLPQRAAQKKGHCDCWSPTAALLLTKSYLGALGTKPRNAATLGAPHGAEEGTVPQNGDPRSAPSARGGACRARSELPRARTSGCATAELLAARRCRRRSEGPARQLRHKQRRGSRPSPRPQNSPRREGPSAARCRPSARFPPPEDEPPPSALRAAIPPPRGVDPSDRPAPAPPQPRVPLGAARPGPVTQRRGPAAGRAPPVEVIDDAEQHQRVHHHAVHRQLRHGAPRPARSGPAPPSARSQPAAGRSPPPGPAPSLPRGGAGPGRHLEKVGGRRARSMRAPPSWGGARDRRRGAILGKWRRCGVR